jgi:hypothetical protein
VPVEISIIQPGFAIGAIRNLGRLQAKEEDASIDAEPGKIPHEVRRPSVQRYSFFARR